jgi:hypothetical protein
MPSAKQILKQLQAEVDEARDTIVDEVLAVTGDPLPPTLATLAVDYREKRVRLDKAQGA